MSAGHVHSIEVGSFVDGPGTRFVVFLAGCPLRCRYCHNPDTWRLGRELTDSKTIVAQMARIAGFLRAGGGGVTVSGGEPLLQAEFAAEILSGAKTLGLHTALDTSGCLGERLTPEMLESIDLVLLDIKSYDEAVYRDVTGGEIGPTLRLAHRLSDTCKPVWVRFVLVPGLTDDPENVAGLARLVAGLSNVERVDIIPFHQMGRHKWEDLGIPYSLADTAPPTPEALRRVKDQFEAAGIRTGEVQPAPCAPRTRDEVMADEDFR
jgi:pyruvate formate lyase activating enzyme